MVKDAGVGGRAVNHVLNPNSHAWLRHHVVILTHVRAFAWVVVHAAKRVVQEFEHHSVQLAALRQRPLEG